jgi:hypothetical protein
MAPSSLQRINGAPHASTERFEQILEILEQDATPIAVIETGQSSWLVAGVCLASNARR